MFVMEFLERACWLLADHFRQGCGRTALGVGVRDVAEVP